MQSKRSLFLLGCFIVVVVFVSFFLLSQTADIRSAMLSARCNERMRLAYASLADFVERTGDLPRDEEGNFSPELLICQAENADGCLTKSDCTCSLAPGESEPFEGILWNRHLDMESFRPSQAGQLKPKDVVVICHDIQPTHFMNRWVPGSPGRWSFVMGDGSLHTVICPVDEYEDWINESFVKGNPRFPEQLDTSIQ
ncbi:hypothetical protein AB1L42_13040 [Thalassoglobus sp. JC818]|uniref:hypothetical protein n=1 Tax=Thalassoglobus sp. JC818 TaxID=3232136 RepID=UPI00345AB0C4